MAEPLDPDTLAEGERLSEKEASAVGLDTYYRATDDLSDWLWSNRLALLAVARDHSNVVDENKALTRALQRIGLAASVEAPTDEFPWVVIQDGGVSDRYATITEAATVALREGGQVDYQPWEGPNA
jgi:hypothetical protein